jgi:hypothetical protein
MSIFDKLFDKLRKKTSAPAEKDMFAKFGKIIYPKIADLSCVVVDRSYKCGQQLKSQIDEKFGKDSKESIMALIRVQYEFLFLFSHLTILFAYSILGDQKARNLQGFLGPLLADSTTESWFGHWPEELKKSIQDNFFTNMNIADNEYAKCNELLIKDEPFSDNAIFSKLAKDIAEIIGCSNDQNAITNIILITVDTFSDMKLQELIKNASSDL